MHGEGNKQQDGKRNRVHKPDGGRSEAFGVASLSSSAVSWLSPHALPPAHDAGDTHDHVNVDCQFVALQGWVVELPPGVALRA